MIRGLVDGFSTILGSFVPVFPFILSFIMNFKIHTALLLSISLTAGSLGIIGSYFGKVSKENILASSGKMVLMGLITAIISVAVERGIHSVI